MKICVLGTGYVGLVTGACLAEMGNSVTCVDVDEARIAALLEGRLPFFEPGLGPVVTRNCGEGRLAFSTSLRQAVASSSIVFVAVGTPPNADASVNVEQIFEAAREIGDALSQNAIVAVKSTVPVGTADSIRGVIEQRIRARGIRLEFHVVSNPEFLKEGSAVGDFMRPDRIVIGSDNAKAVQTMQQLYAPFVRNHDRVLVMGVRDAEMTKYAANAMLATRISLMNEMAALCERLGVDVENMRKGIGSDSRIGYSFLYPGCGFGGSCLPKDLRALLQTGRHSGVELGILEMVEKRNTRQKRRLFERVVERFGHSLTGQVFGLWGLAFKPDTDDVREAPSITLAQLLIEAGASLKAFDPAAAENFVKAADRQRLRRDRLQLVTDQYEAVRDASALLLVTEWRQFRNPDFERMKQLLRTPIIFDGRNQYDPGALRDLGFEYFGIGR